MRKRAETGVHAVDRLAAGGALVDHGPRGADRLVRPSADRDRAMLAGDGADVLQRQRFGVENERVGGHGAP